MIINNNIIIDKLNIIKIPQNNNLSFLIEKANDWKHTINLNINLSEEIDYLNLYIIIKSYLSSSIYPFPEFLVRIVKPNNIIITERTNSSLLTKMTYNEFQKWSQRRINYDLKYYDDSSFYCFSFISNFYLIEEENLIYLKPDYPWKKSLLKEIRSLELKDAISEFKTAEYEKKINELSKKIKKLESMLKDFQK